MTWLKYHDQLRTMYLAVRVNDQRSAGRTYEVLEKYQAVREKYQAVREKY